MTTSVSPADLDEAGPSLAGRAAVTIAMQVGFYVLAFIVLAAMVGFNYVLWQLGRIHIGVIIVTAAVFVGIVKALLSMRIRYEDPFGLEVTTIEPDLAAKVVEVAATVGAQPPDAIYLVPDVNAFVTEHSSWFGLRVNKRILGVGVPLLHVTTVSELQAILGHEFGHFAGGDTKLGAMVYRGHEAARAMLSNLTEGVVGSIFVAYAKQMHRVSGSVSRQQELAADRFAVKAYGSRALSSALSKLDDASTAFEQFAQIYVAPLFDNKVHPTGLFQGFTQVYADPVRTEERSAAVEQRAKREPSPYDTHPTPAARLETLASWPEVVGTETPDERPAIDLLVAGNDSEAQLARMWADRATDHKTKPIDWQEAAAVFGKQAGTVAGFGFARPTIPAEQLAQIARWSASGDWDEPRRRLMKQIQGESSTSERLLFWLNAVVQTAIADQSSGRWNINFSGPAQLLDTSGQTIDTESIAQAFHDGRPDSALATIAAL